MNLYSLHTSDMFHPYALVILGKVHARVLPEGYYMLPVKSFNRLQGNTRDKVQERAAKQIYSGPSWGNMKDL